MARKYSSQGQIIAVVVATVILGGARAISSHLDSGPNFLAGPLVSGLAILLAAVLPFFAAVWARRALGPPLAVYISLVAATVPVSLVPQALSVDARSGMNFPAVAAFHGLLVGVFIAIWPVEEWNLKYRSRWLRIRGQRMWHNILQQHRRSARLQRWQAVVVLGIVLLAALWQTSTDTAATRSLIGQPWWYLAVGAMFLVASILLRAGGSDLFYWLIAIAIGAAGGYLYARFRFNWAWQQPGIAYMVAAITVGMLGGFLVYRWRGQRATQRQKVARSLWIVGLFLAGIRIGLQVDLDQRRERLADVAAFRIDDAPPRRLILSHAEIQTLQFPPHGDPAAFAEMRLFSGTIAVNLAGKHVMDDVLRAIPAWDQVTKLDLRGTSVTDEGLRQLPPLPALERLVLMEGGFSDDALTAFESSPLLHDILIEDTPIRGPGLIRLLQQIATQPGHLLPFSLHLPGTVVDDRFVEQLKGADVAKFLDLRSTRASGKSLPHLVELSTVSGVDLRGVELKVEDFRNVDFWKRLELPNAVPSRQPPSGMPQPAIRRNQLAPSLTLYVDPDRFTPAEMEEIFQQSGIRIEPRQGVIHHW